MFKAVSGPDDAKVVENGETAKSRLSDINTDQYATGARM
jgi:hypothetical protein